MYDWSAYNEKFYQLSEYCREEMEKYKAHSDSKQIEDIEGAYLLLIDKLLLKLAREMVGIPHDAPYLVASVPETGI